MNQTDKTDSNPETVSTVTKYIKIYSDNPIHDCIDRIIGYCEYLERTDHNDYFTFKWMKEASLELAVLCEQRQAKASLKTVQEINAKRTH